MAAQRKYIYAHQMRDSPVLSPIGRHITWMVLDSELKMKISTDDLDMLWIGSFRYYLGRMTISTHSFAESLVQHWGNIPERSKEVIKRDLAEEIKRDDADRERGSEHKSLGHDCDSKMWRAVFAVINQ